MLTKSESKLKIRAMKTKSDRIENDTAGSSRQSSHQQLLACRVCLCTDEDLYSLYKSKLDESYANITGTTLSPHDGLPQHVCRICGTLLLKFTAFRNQCWKTYRYLQDVMEQGLQLTTDYIRNIDKENFKLPPKLETQSLKLDYLRDESQTLDAKIDIKPDTTIDNVDNTIPFVELEIKSDIDMEEVIYDRDTDKEDINKESNINKTSPKKFRAKRSVKFKENYKDFSNMFEVDVVFLDTKQQIEGLKVLKDAESFKRSSYKCEMCYKGFKTESVFEKHMAHHDSKSGDYECDICHLRYSTRNKIAAHVKYHKIRFDCRLCGMSSKCGTSAILHYKWHKGTKYSCKYCGENFSSQSCHHTHVRLEHKVVRCEQCGERLEGTRALGEHARQHPQPHECAKCGMGFQNSEALDKHQCGMSSCAVCGENFTSQDLLEQHTVKSHEGKKCDECGSIWKNEIALKNHWSHVHRGVRRTNAPRGDTRLICEVCAKTCKSPHHLKAHQQIHTDDRPCLCTLCPKRFRDKWALQEHMNHHTGARPHKCPQCPETFKSYNEKSLHKQLVHKKEHRCLQCDKLFLSGTELSRHERSHSGDKPFKCLMCPKEFTLKINLKSHMNNVHSGVRLFKCTNESCSETFTTYRKRHEHNLLVHRIGQAHKCTMCEKLFMTPSELVNHRRMHTGEKPFKCSLCAKTFGRKCNLQVHMNAHTGVKPHKCPFCPETFSSYWKKSQHKTTVHMKKPLRVRDRIKCMDDE